MSNYPELLDMLSTFEIGYWQLVSSGDMPDEYDVALIEGAVTTDEQITFLNKVRETASCVIAIGACAVTGGVVSLATTIDRSEAFEAIYGADAGKLSTRTRTPAPIDEFIKVDFAIPGCPINPEELSRVLQRALRSLVDNPQRQSMCGECKIAENTCVWLQGIPCLGLLARSGCHAMCVSNGRACTACRGIAKDANIQSAYGYAAAHGYRKEEFDKLINIYNAAKEVTS
jgi:coenzyme F420-reducing hydrogenase gamma subunit